MVNRLKVNTILKKLEGYVEDINSLKPISVEELKKDSKKEYAVAFLIEQIVNECINLGNHIVSSENLNIPTSYKKIFEILENNKFVSKEISEKMQRLVEIRNRIAHVYGYLPLEELIEAVSLLTYVEKFARDLTERFKQ